MSGLKNWLAIAVSASALFFIAWAILWVAIPSSLFIKPISISYRWNAEEGFYETVFIRQTPLGEVWADYEVEAYVLNTGRECQDEGAAPYQPVPDPDESAPNRVKDTVFWQTPMRIVRCITDRRPVTVVYDWRVTRILGVPLLFSLRPVSLVVELK